MFSAKEKKCIIAGKIKGLSNVSLAFELNRETGVEIAPYTLGKQINASEDIQSAFSVIQDYVLENIDSIVELADDTE